MYDVSHPYSARHRIYKHTDAWTAPPVLNARCNLKMCKGITSGETKRYKWLPGAHNGHSDTARPSLVIRKLDIVNLMFILWKHAADSMNCVQLMLLLPMCMSPGLNQINCSRKTAVWCSGISDRVTIRSCILTTTPFSDHNVKHFTKSNIHTFKSFFAVTRYCHVIKHFIALDKITL